MLTMYRFMNRQNGHGELDLIVRHQQLDFPSTGPETATPEQREALAKAVADAASREARYGQVVLADWSSTGAIVAAENLAKRGQSDCLTWLV
jgi:hypothetical protein